MTTYAYLGPAGTFTEAALRQITNDSDTLVPYSNVTAALNAVRNGSAEKVLVPIENSVEGVVSRTLDELALGSPLVVTAETTLPVSFSLMVLPERANSEITKIATHPHAESQCRSYVAKNYPQAEIIEMSSTAAAAKGLADGNYDAAIASEIAAKNYGLKIIASNIGDNTGAVTRFVVAQKPQETGTTPAPTGNDRTSLVAFIGIDHAGALLEILTEFAKQDVNLTFIQSRPTGLELGHYHFIIDAEGHIADPKVAAAVEGVRNICEDIRFLGSYPRVGKSN
jgi:prephenate dehydratase